MTNETDLNTARAARIQAVIDTVDAHSNDPTTREDSLFRTHRTANTQTLDRLFSTYDCLLSHA